MLNNVNITSFSIPQNSYELYLLGYIHKVRHTNFVILNPAYVFFTVSHICVDYVTYFAIIFY